MRHREGVAGYGQVKAYDPLFKTGFWVAGTQEIVEEERGLDLTTRSFA